MKKDVTKTQVFALFAVLFVIIGAVIAYGYYATIRMQTLEGTYKPLNHYLAGMPQSFYIDHYVKPAMQAAHK